MALPDEDSSDNFATLAGPSGEVAPVTQQLGSKGVTPVRRELRHFATVSGLGLASSVRSGEKTARDDCGQARMLALRQFGNRFPVIEEVLRPAVEVGQLQGQVDAQDVVDRRQDVLEADAAAFRPLGPG